MVTTVDLNIKRNNHPKIDVELKIFLSKDLTDKEEITRSC